MKFLKNRLIQKLIAATSAMYVSATAFAISVYDPTKDKSGGKTISDVMDNANKTVGQSTTLIIQVVTLFGFIITAISLVTLYKASKDDNREKPTSAIIGLLIGGLMAGVGTIVWIVRNSLLG